MTRNSSSTVRFIQVTPQTSTAGKQGAPNSGPGIKLKPAVKRSRQPVLEDQRKRVRHACESCRSAKEKCQGGAPCERCIRSHATCSLVRDDRVVTPENGERRSGNLCNSDRSKYLERIVSHFFPDTNLNNHELKAIAESLDQPLQKDSELEEGNSNQNSQLRNGLHHSGEDSLRNLSERLKEKITQKISVDQLDGSEHQSSMSEDLPQDWNVDTSASLQSLLHHLPLPQLSNFLIETFYRYTQSNNFYVDRDWLHSKLSHLYNGPFSLRKHDIPGVATVFMILAIGTQYAHMGYDIPLGQYDEPDISATLRSAEDDLGQAIYHQVTRFVPDIITARSLESVQACLLIGVYLFPVDQPGLALTYLELGLNIAIQIGMHRRSFHQNMDERTQEVRNRVWWTLYIFYQQTSILHGHPKTLSHIDVDAERPRRLQELEPVSGASNFENQLILIDLIIILEDISREISNLRRKPQHPVHFMNLVSLKGTLDRLADKMPQLEGHGDTQAVQLDALRLNIHLHLHYLRTRLFLGRPFLLGNNNPKPSSSTSEKPATTSVMNRSFYRDLLVQDSVSAALKIVELCQVLHHRVGLAKASYSTEFTSCRAAMLVLLARSLMDKSNKLREALSCGLKIIKIMSASGGKLASSEGKVIEALERAVKLLNISETATKEKGGAAAAGGWHNTTKENIELREQWEMLWQKEPQPSYQPPIMPPCSATMLDSFASNMATTPVCYDSLNQLTQSWPIGGEMHHASALFPLELGEFNFISEVDVDFGIDPAIPWQQGDLIRGNTGPEVDGLGEDHL